MKRVVKFVVITIILIILWAVAAPIFAKLLIVDKPLEHAEAILVLSGSAVYQERVRRAAELYKQGMASVVFITDDVSRAGWSKTEQRNPPFVDLERKALISDGVPPDAIRVLNGEVRSTIDEARAFKAEVETRPIASVMIVTSAYHSRRALWTFEHVLAGRNVEIGMTTAPNGVRSPNPSVWWITARGWPMVAGEYVKFIWYWAFY